MVSAYSPLSSAPMDKGVSIYQPDQPQTDVVSLEDTATAVMTDLRRVSAVTIELGATLEMAGQRMKERGVRLLLVAGQEGMVAGLITSTDLQGEKPMQHIQKHGGRWSDLLVKDIMTPQDKLEVLSMADVERARVGNIVATMQRAGRQHALVVDRGHNGGAQMVRGIFSAAQIARKLDMEIQANDVVQTFAEIKQLVMGA